MRPNSYRWPIGLPYWSAVDVGVEHLLQSPPPRDMVPSHRPTYWMWNSLKQHHIPVWD